MWLILAGVGIMMVWALISYLISLVEDSKALQELQAKINDGDAYHRNKIAEGNKYYDQRLIFVAPRNGKADFRFASSPLFSAPL